MNLFAFLFFSQVRVLCLRQQRYLRRIHLMVQNGGHMDPHPLSLQRNVLRAVVGYHAQRVEHLAGQGVLLLLVRLDAM